jgi:hypothetical protein
MTPIEIFVKLHDKNTNRILNYGDHEEADRIIEIPTKDLQISNGYMTYVWGFPGPDFNIYDFNDYGETWAFSREEIRSVNESELQ